MKPSSSSKTTPLMYTLDDGGGLLPLRASSWQAAFEHLSREPRGIHFFPLVVNEAGLGPSDDNIAGYTAAAFVVTELPSEDALNGIAHAVIDDPVMPVVILPTKDARAGEALIPECERQLRVRGIAIEHPLSTGVGLPAPRELRFSLDGSYIDELVELPPAPIPRRRRSKEVSGGEFIRGDETEFAQRLLAALSFEGAPAVYDNGALHAYDVATGCWRPVPSSEQSKIVQSFAGAQNRSSKTNARIKINQRHVAGASKLAQAQAARKDFFAKAVPGIGFTNGFMKVEDFSLVFEPHSPEHRATASLSFDYVANAECPTFKAAIQACFLGDDDADDKIACLQEFAGACLLGIAPRYQRCIVMFGGGGNGKSVITDCISGMLPKSLVSSVPPHLWDNEYRRAQLPGIRLNAVAEIPERNIASSDMFKAMISGDPIDARPIRQEPFTFRPVAGHLFSANALPNLKDLTDGFWRRFIVIPFNRKFDGDEKEIGLASRLLATERVGIVNWALDGSRRLLDRGGNSDFVIPPSSDAAKRGWKHQCDSVALFLEDEAYKDAGPWPAARELWTPAKPLYQGYRKWCQENGHHPVSSKKFSARMTELGRGSQRSSEGRFYPVVHPAVGDPPLLSVVG